MAASQQPLLPVQHGSPVQPGLAALRRPSHASPGKELVLAVQQGDVEGALRAASWACVRSPFLLLTIVACLIGALALASWLLPQHSLASALHQASRRQGGPRQRTFLEELTREEQQQLMAAAAKHAPAGQHKPHLKVVRSREEMLDALVFPQARGDAHEAAADSKLVAASGPPSEDAAAGNASDGHGEVFNIHEVAKVPPLFGDHP